MTTEATKVCPDCRETIQAQAVVCRYCGYDYEMGGRAVTKSTNGMAVASMVLGILWIWWVGSILALIFGYKARNQIDRSNGAQSGRGMAIAGIVLGWIGIATLVLFVGLLTVSSTSGDIGS